MYILTNLIEKWWKLFFLVLLRECVLRNTAYCYALVLNTGSDTKVMKSSTETRAFFSYYWFIYLLLLLLFIIIVHFFIFYLFIVFFIVYSLSFSINNGPLIIYISWLTLLRIIKNYYLWNIFWFFNIFSIWCIFIFILMFGAHNLFRCEGVWFGQRD